MFLICEKMSKAILLHEKMNKKRKSNYFLPFTISHSCEELFTHLCYNFSGTDYRRYERPFIKPSAAGKSQGLKLHLRTISTHSYPIFGFYGEDSSKKTLPRLVHFWGMELHPLGVAKTTNHIISANVFKTCTPML